MPNIGGARRWGHLSRHLPDAGQVGLTPARMVAIGALVPDSSSQASMPAKPLPTTARDAAEAGNEARAITASCSSPSPRTFRGSSYSPRRLVPNSSWSSAFTLQTTPAASSAGSGWCTWVGGVIGVLLTGAFASLAINAAAAAASLTQVGKQAVLAGVTVAFSFAATLAILEITDVTIGLRVTEEHEEAGLDSSQHGEMGYRI